MAKPKKGNYIGNAKKIITKVKWGREREMESPQLQVYKHQRSFVVLVFKWHQRVLKLYRDYFFYIFFFWVGWIGSLQFFFFASAICIWPLTITTPHQRRPTDRPNSCRSESVVAWEVMLKCVYCCTRRWPKLGRSFGFGKKENVGGKNPQKIM